MYGGVTYQRTIAPNFSRNEGLSKEIDFWENEQQNSCLREVVGVLRVRGRERGGEG